MSTRGTAYFEIQDTLDKDPVRVGRINIARDAYKSGFGYAVCGLLAEAWIADEDDSKAKSANCLFKNVERAILYVIYNYPSDIFEEDEYIFKFTFKPFLNADRAYRVSEVIHVDVKHKYGDNDFSGSFSDFVGYCKPSW